MSEFQTRQKWSGIDNRVNAKAMPPGSVRDMVNLDPLPGGVLGLRSGFTKRSDALSARGALAVKDCIVYADGTQLTAYSTTTNSQVVLGAVAGSGRLVGSVLNEELFFCTENETLRFDGNRLRPWGVPTVDYQPVPTVVAGGFAPGGYLVACSHVDAFGDEGSTGTPILMNMDAGTGLHVTLPTPLVGGRVRLWVGPRDGGTLYLQFEGEGEAVVTNVRDDTQRLDLINLRPPMVADHMESSRSVLLMAEGKTLWFTLPMRPHLVNVSKSFFQYPAPIDVLIGTTGDAGPGGVYVCSDKTYWITGLETDDPQQVVMLPHGAVPGTAVELPSGKVAWMTRYGLAVGDESGKIQLVSEANFVPDPADHGASGMLEHNGNQLVVTTMQSTGNNPLAAGDYYDLEIVPT